MSEKEELLNNLKINKEEKTDTDPLPIKQLLQIGGALIFFVIIGSWFFSDEDLQEVSSVLVKPVSVSGAPSASVLDASGYVTARRQATVSSKITGKVMEVFIEEGMFVKKGQILAQLDDSTFQAELNYSISQLNEAERIYNRRLELMKEKLISQSSLDSALAQLEGMQAKTEVSKQIVADMKILAPFSGIVVDKAAQPGEMISPISAGGGFTRTGICTIVDMDSLEIEVDVNESYINRVESGQPALATLNAYPNWDIPAEVIAIIPTADRNKATVQVRIGFLERDQRVLPDMGAKVSFLEKSSSSSAKNIDGVVVPNSAVSKQGEEHYVFLIKDGKLLKQSVILVDKTSNYSRIIEGIRVGDRVAESYNSSYKDNQKIEVK
ncbi:MAG: efflux RND transporter periplasmic adaptor subunit [SAR86 cluster bacterium]|nr:efflux RND transporter periplasmic adaptor subunit [SAR86 cluster bacterium]